MYIKLTPEHEAMLREKVESGLYVSKSEVVREALRLLDERDTLDRLRSASAAGDQRAAHARVTERTPDQANGTLPRGRSGQGRQEAEH